MNVQVTIGVTPELAKLLDGLTRVVSVMESAAEAPIQQEAPVQQQAPSQQEAPIQQQAPIAEQSLPTAVPTAATSYTMEQLAVAATQLMDAGKRDELLALLGTFGIQALTALPKDQYGTFATKLREKGVKI